MSYNILVVDDSPTMRQLLSFALKRISNVKVMEAGDGVEGYKVLSSNEIDLVIADINMPVMDGLKMISIIKSNPAYAKIPVIIVTTEGGREDRDKALALGANSYITKPIQAGDVVNTVKKLLDIT